MNNPIISQETDSKAPSKGKWLSVYLDPEEVSIVEGIQSKFKSFDLPISISKILRQYLSIGFKSTDNDGVLDDPASFFLNSTNGGQRP